MIHEKKINFESSNIKSMVSPLVEIVHFDKNNKQSKKETYPITHYLDNACHNLKKLNTHLN
jgi:hypothetical protein